MHFRMQNFTYFEDDFVLMQKNVIPPSQPSDGGKHIQFEPKDKSKGKAQVAAIEWSQDGRFIVVCFKQEVNIAIWDVLSCRKVLNLT